jgi:hypothetical protein
MSHLCGYTVVWGRHSALLPAPVSVLLQFTATRWGDHRGEHGV